MKNNIRALGFHLVIVLLSIILLVVFVATGPVLGKHTSNIASRMFIGIVFIFAYLFAGTFLDINRDKRYDFLVGSFVALVGIAIWSYTFFITGKNLFVIPAEYRDYWILMNIYHTPFIFINFIFDLPNVPLLGIVENLIPSFLMGLGMKYKRKRVQETILFM